MWARRLDLASLGALQRADHFAGLASRRRRARDALRRPRPRQIYQSTSTARGDLVAQQKLCFRTDRDAAARRHQIRSLKGKAPRTLRAEELDRVYASMPRRRSRGEDPLFRGCRAGRKAATLAKGPMTITASSLRARLGRALYPRQQAQLKQIQPHPGLASRTGSASPIVPSGALGSGDGRLVGAPGVYDYARALFWLTITSPTDGDDGFLVNAKSKIPATTRNDMLFIDAP